MDDGTHAIRTFHGAIDEVLKHPPGPSRWKAAVDLWLSLSPEHRKAHNEVTKYNRMLREASGAFNKYGKSKDKNSGFRSYMTFPAVGNTSPKLFIEMADPLAFKKPENAARMRKTFPAYCTSEAY